MSIEIVWLLARAVLVTAALMTVAVLALSRV